MMLQPAEVLVDIQKLDFAKTYWINSSVEGLQIKKEVDTSSCESAHTAIVVSGGVNMVYSNGICAKGSHGRGIELALGCID
jgi:hypothetical protein